MKKILVVALTLLSTSIVFADTKQDIQSLSNRMYILQNELLNPDRNNSKTLEDIKYIRAISGHLTSRLTSEYKSTKDLSERTNIGNTIIAAILYQLALDHAEQYIQTNGVDELRNFISKVSLADLISKSIK